MKGGVNESLTTKPRLSTSFPACAGAASELGSDSDESLGGSCGVTAPDPLAAVAEPLPAKDPLPAAAGVSAVICAGGSAVMCVSRSSPLSKLGNEPEISLVTLGVLVMLNCVLNT